MQYRRHFLVDNSVFHGELPWVFVWVAFYCVSDSTFLPASGCKGGIIVGLSQELE